MLPDPAMFGIAVTKSACSSLQGVNSWHADRRIGRAASWKLIHSHDSQRVMRLISVRGRIERPCALFNGFWRSHKRRTERKCRDMIWHQLKARLIERNVSVPVRAHLSVAAVTGRADSQRQGSALAQHQ